MRRLLTSVVLAALVTGGLGVPGTAYAGAAAGVPPRVISSPVVVRPSSELHPELVDMHFRVQAFSSEEQTGRVDLRDAAGRLLLSRTVRHCQVANPCTPDWEFRVQPYLPGGGALPPGAYRASAVQPDSLGQPVTVTFPPFVVQTLDEASARFRRPARLVDVPEASSTGRCARLRQTGRPRGSLGLYSGVGCRSRRNGADAVTRVFRLPLADVAGYERLNHVLIRMRYDRSGARGRIRVRARIPSLDLRWTGMDTRRPFLTRRHYWFSYADLHPSSTVDYRDGVLEVKVRVSGGARLDVRRVAVEPQYFVWR